MENTVYPSSIFQIGDSLEKLRENAFCVCRTGAHGARVCGGGGGDCENANDCVTNKPITTISVRPAATAPAVNLTSVGSDNCLGSVSGGLETAYFPSAAALRRSRWSAIGVPTVAVCRSWAKQERLSPSCV